MNAKTSSVRYDRWVAVLLVWVAAWPCIAQTPIAPDRPGFGDAASVVAPGDFQVEAGYTYTDLGLEDQHAFGQVLLRLGLARRVEVRVGLNSYVFQEQVCPAFFPCAQDNEYDKGFEDLTLGAKVKLVEGSGDAQPVLTAIVGAAVPTGDEAFTADHVQPALTLALDLALSEAVAFSGNAGYTFTLGDDRVDEFVTYASLGAGIPGIDGLGIFVGLYTVFPRSGSVGNDLDGGLVYLFDTVTQFDLNLGLGLTQDEPDFFVGVGIARRF